MTINKFKGGDVMYRTFTKEELIADMPSYYIFMVLGDGWYVYDKLNRKTKRFDFRTTTSYLKVLEYAESLG